MDGWMDRWVSGRMNGLWIRHRVHVWGENGWTGGWVSG